MVEISTCAGPSGSPSGAGMYFRMASNSGRRSVPGRVQIQRRRTRAGGGVENRVIRCVAFVGVQVDQQVEDLAHHLFAARVGAVNLVDDNRCTFSFSSSAFCSTKRVCGIGPSKLSTSSSTPSTIFSTRSTSPPKSAWPGVSTMLIFVLPCNARRCSSPEW